MKLKLIAWAPSKRFDADRSLCSDGRGGWQFSQVNVDRLITDYEDYWLICYIGVLVEDAERDDYVESSRILAEMNGEKIGEQQLDWKRPNPMWNYAEGCSIFEFSQPIMMQPKGDGLITFALNVKLHSQPDWTSVDGCGYCRVRRVEEADMPKRWYGPTSFSLRTLFRKPVWLTPNRN